MGADRWHVRWYNSEKDETGIIDDSEGTRTEAVSCAERCEPGCDGWIYWTEPVLAICAARRLPVSAAELQAMKDKIATTCLAVVHERLAIGTGSTVETVAAQSLIGELGMPWSGAEAERATVKEEAAHRAIQDYWRALEHSEQ